MKRKLNEEDVPTPLDREDNATKSNAFDSFGLDARLLQAILKQNYAAPTAVQSKAIPLALAGKDVLVRSKTGSGKSAAYILPIAHVILREKKAGKKQKHIHALVLVPTKELAQQITKVIAALTSFCEQEIRVTNLTQKVPDTVHRTLLAESPEIVVATPSRAAQNIKTGALSVDNIKSLVVDEADLVLSYGYEDDFQIIAEAVPKGVQTSLISATLSTEVDTLKGLLCRNPVTVDLKEKTEDGGGVSQYVVNCAEDEKFLLVYVVYKLKLIKGKSIIFVGDTDRCYRLKLFLEQFGISSCVLNSELPVNSRIHVVEEYNKNVYDIIIASDEHEVVGGEEVSKEETVNEKKEHAQVKAANGENGDEPKRRKKQPKKSKYGKEYGISRGVDFQNVACVLNFDLPTTSDSYTHRIGRTARAGKTGMALSFVIPKTEYRKHKSTSFPTCEHDEDVLASITADQAAKGKEVKPYHFDMKQVNAFRYRMNDALRAVTAPKIREVRVKEIRQELLKSEKLKRHFEEHPEDLRHLRHDTETGVIRRQAHLRHVPDYLMPKTGANGVVKDSSGQLGFVAMRKAEGDKNRLRRIREFKRGRAASKGKGDKGGRSSKGRRGDVLKTLKTR